MSTFEEISVEIQHLSENCPFIPAATLDDCIYTSFNASPHLTSDEDQNGMWQVVNNKMDSILGVDVMETNLRTGPYGIEHVLQWLRRAREHESWNHDALLIIRLRNIRSKFIGMCSKLYQVI